MPEKATASKLQAQPDSHDLAAAETAEANAAADCSLQGPNNDPPEKTPYLYHLASTTKQHYDGGYLQGATEDTFPALERQRGSVYFVQLEPGGIREPHWHPSAWELSYVMSGSAKWVVLGPHPDGVYIRSEFQAGPGDLIFAPQGHFHYFENTSSENTLDVLIVFNTSTKEPNDDLGIVAAFNAIPRDVLAATFKTPPTAFDHMPPTMEPVVIAKR
ncbi:cupin domain-containing protein [Nocardia brasiliensis]|uniref:cupin domain-containing protein n=1 Tax=Nocardia brasiliensis TaxID=37326 RepID=UPI0024588922|nr:cupin domain-containing protein [Nocardia brasiliensis]